MVYNRYYILGITNDQLNAKWSVNFQTPDAERAPIVLIAKSVLPPDQLADAIASIIADIHNGEGGYVKAGISLTVHANVVGDELQDRLQSLAQDVRDGHGF